MGGGNYYEPGKISAGGMRRDEEAVHPTSRGDEILNTSLVSTPSPGRRKRVAYPSPTARCPRVYVWR